MKTLPPGMQARLDGGATTLCWCWKLTRADGVVVGFTDHDRDLVVDGVAYEAASGFTASEVKTTAGLAVDDLEVDGALTSGSLTEDDLQAGLWDDAGVELRRVDWSDPALAVLMRKGSIGEVRRGRHAFTAELRGLAHELDQEVGRVYGYSCDAEFGDARCGVDATVAAWRLEATVAAVGAGGRIVRADALAGVSDDLFTRGRLEVLSTAAAVLGVFDVRLHRGGEVRLWTVPTVTIAAGATIRCTAGCDKQFTTCRDRFANATNFRGFPYMPSNDLVVSYPSDGTENDGGSLYGN